MNEWTKIEWMNEWTKNGWKNEPQINECMN